MISRLASKFIQARNYTKGPRNVPVDWLVIHDMEMEETSHTAEDCANFFANQRPGNDGSSANYCVDNDSIVCSVDENDIAWHAPHANHNGIGIEHAGRASQRAQDWADPFSEAMLHLSARLAADICARNALPVRFVDAAGLKRGDKGITTHWEVTKAFGPVGGHTDPGPNFPMSHYIDLVKVASGGAPTPTPEEDEMQQFPVICEPGKRTVVPLPNAGAYKSRWVAVFSENAQPGLIGIGPGPGQFRDQTKSLPAGEYGGFPAQPTDRYLVVVNDGTEPVTAWVEFAAT